MLAWPGREWVAPRTAEGGARPFYDVAIVGAGQCGLAAAYGLMREKVTNVVCLDENEVSTKEHWFCVAESVPPAVQTPSSQQQPRILLVCLPTCQSCLVV